jgi:hypothetical protein
MAFGDDEYNENGDENRNQQCSSLMLYNKPETPYKFDPTI